MSIEQTPARLFANNDELVQAKKQSIFRLFMLGFNFVKPRINNVEGSLHVQMFFGKNAICERRK